MQAPKSTRRTAVARRSNNKKEAPNNLLLAFVPPAKCVGIKLDYGKPQSFSSEQDRIEWEEQSMREAEVLKEKLETGEIKVKQVDDRVVVNPPRTKINPEAIERYTKQMHMQEQSLSMEHLFIQLSQRLRECLGLKQADVDACLQVLEEYKKIKFAPLMLLRNPDCVDIIRRLRRYVGNLREWQLTEEEEAQFKAKAEIIRNEAVVIYNNFKSYLPLVDKKHFWAEFLLQVDNYKENTKHLRESTRFVISEEIYEKILEEKRQMAEVRKAAGLDSDSENEKKQSSGTEAEQQTTAPAQSEQPEALSEAQQQEHNELMQEIKQELSLQQQEQAAEQEQEQQQVELVENAANAETANGDTEILTPAALAAHGIILTQSDAEARGEEEEEEENGIVVHAIVENDMGEEVLEEHMLEETVGEVEVTIEGEEDSMEVDGVPFDASTGR